MNRSMPGLPVHHQLPEFTQTHVHRVSDAIQPSHLRSSPSPPAPNPSQHQSLFQWVNSVHKRILSDNFYMVVYKHSCSLQNSAVYYPCWKKIYLSLNNYLLDYIRIFKASGDTDCETYIYIHTQRKHFSENVCAYVLSHVQPARLLWPWNFPGRNS